MSICHRAEVGQLVRFKRGWTGYSPRFCAFTGDVAEVVKVDTRGYNPMGDRCTLRLVKNGETYGNWNLPDDWFELLPCSEPVKDLTDEERSRAKEFGNPDDILNFFDLT